MSEKDYKECPKCKRMNYKTARFCGNYGHRGCDHKFAEFYIGHSFRNSDPSALRRAFA